MLQNPKTLKPTIQGSQILAPTVATTFRVFGSIYPFGRNRYFAYILSRLGSKLAKAAQCRLPLQGGGVFTFPMKDKYWIKLLMPGFVYEPEVDFLIEFVAQRSKKTLLIDCGANFGYWVARTKQYPGLNVIAIEPSPTALEYLRLNVEANSEHAELCERAVWKLSDQTLEFASSSKLHAGSALASVARHGTEQGDWAVTSVLTTSIDTIAKKHRQDHHEMVVIKLDVEGAEVDAIEGARDTLNSGEAVLIYEDHASDPEHHITAFLMQLGMIVYHFRGRTLVRVHSLDEMQKLKAPKTYGYNFYNFAACLPQSKSHLLLQEIVAKE